MNRKIILSVLSISLFIYSCGGNDNTTPNNDEYKNTNCDRKWTQEMIDRGIEACVATNNTVEVCTCVVETTAKELTLCETETPEGLAKRLEISLNCGVQPDVE